MNNLKKSVYSNRNRKIKNKTGKFKNHSKKEKLADIQDLSFQKFIKDKDISKIHGFQRRIVSLEYNTIPQITKNNHLSTQKNEITRVSICLPKYQKTKFKQLEDFFKSISPKVRLYRMRYLSESYFDLGQLGTGKTATVKKIQRKSDSKCFTGKFFDLEKLVSNGFLRRLKVVNSNGNVFLIMNILNFNLK